VQIRCGSGADWFKCHASDSQKVGLNGVRVPLSGETRFWLKHVSTNPVYRYCPASFDASLGFDPPNFRRH